MKHDTAPQVHLGDDHLEKSVMMAHMQMSMMLFGCIDRKHGLTLSSEHRRLEAQSCNIPDETMMTALIGCPCPPLCNLG